MCRSRIVHAVSARRARGGPRRVEPRAEDRVDLHVESTPIDLGLVQGFTTAADQRDGHVAGEPRRHRFGRRSASGRHDHAAERRLHGPPTGVNYTNCRRQGRSAARQRAHRRRSRRSTTISMPLTISGDLAVHERQRRRRAGVHQRATISRSSTTRWATSASIATCRSRGELRAPRIEGDLGVDHRLDQSRPDPGAVGESAYSTAPDRVRDDAGRARPRRRGAADRAQALSTR